MAENKEEKSVNVEKEEKKQEIQKEVPKEPVKKEVKKETEKKEEKKPTEKKEDTTFKKAEKKDVKKKSNHGFLKTILVLIGILVIAYFIFAMRNYIILKDLCDKASKYIDVANYTYHAKTSFGGYTVAVKDGVTRFETNNKDSSKNMIIWADSNTKESIVAFPNQRTAIKNQLSGVVATVPFNLTQGDYLIMNSMLYAWIHSGEFDGKDCYIIHMGSDYELWVDKETGLVVKETLTDDELTEITNIGIDNVSEIYKPDLTGYEINN